MNSSEIRETIIRYIKELSEENNKTLTEIKPEQSIMEDIGLSSIQVATLLSFLETDFGYDPFMSGDVSITDIRTVGELCKIYETTLEKNIQS